MYKINSTRIEGETLTASVTYTLKDDTLLDIDVPIFQPQSVDDVLNGIANREVSEQSKHDAIPTNETIQDQLQAEYIDKTFVVDDARISRIKE